MAIGRIDLMTAQKPSIYSVRGAQPLTRHFAPTDHVSLSRLASNKAGGVKLDLLFIFSPMIAAVAANKALPLAVLGSGLIAAVTLLNKFKPIKQLLFNKTAACVQGILGGTALVGAALLSSPFSLLVGTALLVGAVISVAGSKAQANLKGEQA